MSADRYEITDHGERGIEIKFDERTFDVHPESVAANAIRQQARDIAELEVFAEIGRQWNADSSLAKWFPLTAERVEQDAQEIAQLRADLAAALGLVEIREPTPEECEEIERLWSRTLDSVSETQEVRPETCGRAMFTAVSKWLKGEL